MVYRMDLGDGESFEVTLDEFFDSNREYVGTDDEITIRTLAIGGVFRDGGGAQPSWSIERVS